VKRLLVDSMPNMRDIGGYKAENGSIKYGVFIRSNVPLRLSKNDIDYLLENNITTIIDLRRKEEVETDPSALENIEGFDYKIIPIYETGTFTRNKDVIAKEYFNILESKEAIREIFKIFLNSRSGIIYNCASGKDRTGVLTALLMLTLGVSKNDIAHEYAVTTEYLADTIRYNFKLDKDYIIKDFFPAYEEIMLEVIELIDIKYGGITKYLNDIGITNEEIEKLKHKSIE
jgi:protein-tyrosine phosphatase